MEIHLSEFFAQLPSFSSEKAILSSYQNAKDLKHRPVLVLDDDPTGIQTVQGIPVYMSWDTDVMEQIFNESEIAFIHTNTRAYAPAKVKLLLQKIMQQAVAFSKKTGLDFDVISRSDSTLRGHYPLETEIVRDEYEKAMKHQVDGEIIVPFFKEGGRFTAHDVHVAVDGDVCIPASETEFARDPDFGYQHADLKHYVEEKTGGKFNHKEVISISLDMLRHRRTDEIKQLLKSASGFNKIVVNAVDYLDLKAFIPTLLEAMNEGKKFIFRTAASFVKTFGFIDDKPLLERKDFKGITNKQPTILLVAGSYTGKTTAQLNSLFQDHRVERVEMDVKQVLGSNFYNEIERIANHLDELISSGRNPVLYTSRTLLKTDDHLKTAETISKALTSIVQRLYQKPDLIVAKGGITSSVIAVEGLKMKKAMVQGQVLPGIPVIVAGKESKWPGIPYVIFPGNVGHINAISELYGKLNNHLV